MADEHRGPELHPVGPDAPPDVTSGWAVASLVFGVLGVITIPVVGSILAIVFARVARKRIRASNGRVGGDGLAAAGLTLGVIGLFGALVIFGLFGFRF